MEASLFSTCPPPVMLSVPCASPFSQSRRGPEFIHREFVPSTVTTPRDPSFGAIKPPLPVSTRPPALMLSVPWSSPATPRLSEMLKRDPAPETLTKPLLPGLTDNPHVKH